MPRSIPFLHRRMAEESVRRGMAAAVVMEAAAREWTSADGEEAFPAWLVRREVLRPEQVAELEEAVKDEVEAPAEGGAPGEPAAAPRAPHPSEVIKGYRILERLGRGGMGSVYRAEQAGMNRVVALKILRRPLGESPEQVERLKREARLVGSLDHPHIVRGLDVGQHGPYHYFAMEFVEGETLRDALKRRGVLPEAEALRIVEQVCLALDHAHSRAVVHRDVKPGNIILTPDGTPKLTDYGLAKGPADFSLTQSGVTIGTPQYLSPEQAREPARVDIQTDLYSLGATAYHMLAGIPPHTSETLAGLLTKVLYEKPRTVRQVNPRVSAGASFLVEKLMAKQKRHRYRTPKEVLRDLRALAAGKSIVPRDWTGDFEVQEVRRRYRIGITALVGVTAASVVFALWLQHRFEVAERRARETQAAVRLQEIWPQDSGRRPKDRVGWQVLGEDLDAFLRHPDHSRTPSRAEAESYRGLVQRHIDQWREEEDVLGRAQRLADDQGNFRGACEAIAEALPAFEQAGTFGRDPLRALRESHDFFRRKGLRAAEREASEARDRAEKLEHGPYAAGHVERILTDARGRIVDLLVVSEDCQPVQDLDRLLRALRSAEAIHEDAVFPKTSRDEVDRAEGGNRYGAAWEVLEQARQRMENEPNLLLALQNLPEPAAWDLRTRISRRAEALKDRNRTWLKETLKAAEERAARGEFDGAASLLDLAEARSLQDEEFSSAIRERAGALTALREQAEAASRKAVAAVLEGFLDALTRRDYDRAARLLREAEAPGPPAAPDPRVVQAAAAARDLLRRIEAVAFDPVRERVREGKDFKMGLRFQGRRPRDLQVSNVVLKETPTGEVLVYDAPGERGLQFPLHRLALDVLFFYVPLQEGLTQEQALVRGALVIADVDREGILDISLRELEDARTLVLRGRDALPALDPVVQALLDRADEIRDRIVGRQKDLEREAEETWAAVEQALRDQNPPEAIRRLGLIRKALMGTQFIRNRLPLLAEKERDVQRMIVALNVKGIFPHAEVSESPGEPGRGSPTRVLWTFGGDAALSDFVPPEDGGAPLYAFVPEEGGALAFRGPEPGGAPDAPRRWTYESPVTVDCPFKPTRAIAVSFTWRAEKPLALQVSLLTYHLIVMTDDGSRESGRGIFAWQAPGWRDADSRVPPDYRHDHVSRLDLSRVRDPKGDKYFQFEPGKTYAVRVVLENGRLRLYVDGQEKWSAQPPGGSSAVKVPRRIRILSWTPGVLDDLAIEGEVDTTALGDLVRLREALFRGK